MDEILLALLKIAKDNQITVIWSKRFLAEMPPVALIRQKKIIMNSNWPQKNEIIFQLAHELAHFLNNEPYYAALYQTGNSNLLKIEAQVNRFAIKILLTIYFNNFSAENLDPENLLKSFGIPPGCTSLFYQILREFLKLPNS